MLCKNEAGIRMPFKIFVRMLLDGLAGVQALLIKRNITDVLAIIKAHFHFYAAIPSLLQKRKAIQKVAVSNYSRSIVMQYFLWNKKYFSQL